MSLSILAGKGALWQISGGGAQAIIRLGSSMILARKLDPVDFGIFGMAHIVYGMFELLSINGMTSGIITKQYPTEDDLSTCFWSTIVVRIIIFTILLISAPYIASYLNDNNLSITIRTVSLLILITGLGSVSQTLLTKALKFKEISLIKSIGVLIESGLAVALSLTTNLKYWSLVLAMLISIGLINIVFILYAKWYPKLLFSNDSFRYLIRFGINNMGSTITAYLSYNFDYFIVTKLLGTKMLGYYEYAYRIPHLINEKISGPVGMVVFPVLAKTKEYDNKIADGFLASSKYVAWVTFPALGGLAILSHSIVNFLWGEKWLVIVVPLQILCISAAINSVSDFSKAIFLCKNRPDLTFKFEIFTFAIAVISVCALGYLYGIIGVAIGMVIARSSSVVAMSYGLRLVNSSTSEMFKVLRAPVVSTIIMMGVVYSINRFIIKSNNNLELLSCVIFGVLSFIATVRTVYRDDYTDLISKAKVIAFSNK